MGKTVDDFVGNASTGIGTLTQYLGFLWNSTGAYTELSPPINNECSIVMDMDDSLSSSGYTTAVPGGNPLPAFWSSSGAVTQPTLPSGGRSGHATGINGNGSAIVGDVNFPGAGYDGAVYWSTSSPASPVVLYAGESRAIDINVNGQICGWITSGGSNYAAGFSASSAPNTVWQCPNAGSEAVAINASGVSCGYDGTKAAKWTSTGTETTMTGQRHFHQRQFGGNRRTGDAAARRRGSGWIVASADF